MKKLMFVLLMAVMLVSKPVSAGVANPGDVGWAQLSVEKSGFWAYTCKTQVQFTDPNIRHAIYVVWKDNNTGQLGSRSTGYSSSGQSDTFYESSRYSFEKCYVKYAHN